ncbi:efflux RND transporter periplasmic adaptor subunit [Aestuariivivens sediminicola]|uniref:efflux RND transporter periplasmic adaptor subunit n=1 Tax=Aestuariivivens sediminicola TaxID=2913560 RepID=UPI001F55B958|nr:efflux RND transporter periplasmic adaptor subunit [Aestuariivivens sediminicola]
MKQYAIYSGILVIGLLLGWLLFGNPKDTSANDNGRDVTASQQMWICSMHPQIMQPEPGDCPICGMDLIPVESEAGGLTPDQFRLTPNAMALANIQTTTVGQVVGEEMAIKLSGKIGANEQANTVQVSYMSGRIEKLHVAFNGEVVRKGQLLATVYSPELYAAQQELITAASLKESQPELYKAVRNKLKIWKLTDDQINQIEKTGEVKENIAVYATVSGTVTEKLVEEGDYIKQGQALFKIANLSTVWANFDVYEYQINALKQGQEVVIIANAYPNRTFKGTVDFIDPVLNTASRTVTLRVELNNQEDILKPGMFVSAKIRRPNALTNDIMSIPSSAVLWTGERSVVYLKTDPNAPVFEMKEVILGTQTGEHYEVLQGLSPGDEIVINGTFTIDAAAQLQGKKSMMNRSGGAFMTGHEGHTDHEKSSAITEDHSHPMKRLDVSPVFQKHLKDIYEDYINIKNALIKDDTEKALDNANRMLESLNGTDISLVKDDALRQWTSLEKEIKLAARAISMSNEIKTQRAQFKPLSEHLIKALELFGINEKVYVEYCPMADNNKGAYWLSKEEKLLNPYFGDAMLKCGEIRQVIE